MSTAYRAIPAVDQLVADCRALESEAPRSVLVRAVREAVDALRASIARGGADAAGIEAYFRSGAFREEVRVRLGRLAEPRHVRVVNATGVLLHTGLGRAPLCDSAIRAIERVARYGIVEVDPASGERGRRETFVRELLTDLTGAEEATVVNNNAAAVMLLLRGLARGKQVVVSRGELVEIGGGFRVPSVMAESGARLVEVGTTNRTRIEDYEAAIGPETAMLLQVHTSNFKLVGFTEAPPAAELAALGRRTDTPVCSDLGSGYLRRFAALPFPEEPAVRDAVAAGLDVVTFSGDKMLGGPQCGILVGRRDLILRLRGESLFRALRPDKLTLAALEATLLEWRAAGDEPPCALPFYRALLESPAIREQRARTIAEQVALLPLGVAVRASTGQVGSGSVPGQGLPSVAVTLEGPGGQADLLAAKLRALDPPVFTRVQDGRVWLDLLSVPAEEDATVVNALARLAAQS